MRSGWQYGISDLQEIKEDNTKQIMVLTQSVKENQEDIKRCIVLTTDEIIKSYADLERKLNRKLEEN